MEYVVVSSSTPNTVFVDGIPQGKTSELLLVAAGTHEFSLGPPGASGSKKKLAVIKDTSSVRPAEVKF